METWEKKESKKKANNMCIDRDELKKLSMVMATHDNDNIELTRK